MKSMLFEMFVVSVVLIMAGIFCYVMSAVDAEISEMVAYYHAIEKGD